MAHYARLVQEARHLEEGKYQGMPLSLLGVARLKFMQEERRRCCTAVSISSSPF
jgi:hypothetical protein